MRRTAQVNGSHADGKARRRELPPPQANSMKIKAAIPNDSSRSRSNHDLRTDNAKLNEVSGELYGPRTTVQAG